MKSAEEMMCDWIQSRLDANQTFTINSEQYLEILNWFQSVQLGQEKAEYMTKYDKRTDSNHAEIRDGLRKAGYEVEDTSWIGRGHVDLMVRGDFRTVMLEVKSGDAKLTDAERELHTKFSGCGWHIVRTLEQALDVMRKETI